MNGRKAGGRLLVLLAASATLVAGVAACGPRADDIDQVQPGYVRKSIFQQQSDWYYRRTVAKSETTNGYVIEGSGDLPLDRIRWRIEETKLVAYKPYENIPGSETEQAEGSLGFQGTIVASFPIVGHFDIRRGYDSVTGNETNVVAENAIDRPWHERDLMRVNWAAEEIAGSFADNLYEFPVDWVSSAKFWQNIETDPTNEFAARFSDDYVEFSHSALLGMDLYTCWAFTGFSSASGGCGFGEAQIRHSFVRVKEKSDFIPRNYPDSVVRKGADGNPITDPTTGEVVREPIFSRFGVFRREVPTYDPGYGYTESGKIFRAMVFNIWERHTNDNGEEIPCSLAEGCERVPKPVIYYLNAEYPERWRPVAREVANEYDRVLKSMVQDLVGAERTPEHMFEIRDNDCNVGKVRSFAANNRDLEYAVARAVCREGEACSDPISKVAFGNLTKVCTSLEAATRDASGKPGFDWQRIGDARFNMLVYLLNPQDSGWGGYGPMHSDSRTGETVSATSYIRGNYYETTASTIVDYIELINDERSIEDIVYGQDIRKHISAVLARGQALSSMSASREYSALMEDRLKKYGSTKEEMLREVSPDHQLNRIKRIEGTRAEEAAITELDLLMAGGGSWKPGQPVTDELRKAASPLGRVTTANPASVVRRQARAALGAAGFCDLKHELDPHWAGLALALKDVSPEDRYEIVASKLIKHVMLHELGHNFGLSHNFEGTFDALNYGDTFWTYAWSSDGDKVVNRADEHRNTTVMEYVGQGKSAFSDYLGKYDEAAIRFAYVNQVAVFASPKVNPALEGGEKLRAWRYQNDYMKIPDHLCAAGGCGTPEDRFEVLTARSWKDFDAQNPPPNEVPFLFCDNRFDGVTPFCSTFDYGSNLREIFANYYTRWSNYFFFNNFIRDRLVPLAWSPRAAMGPLMDAIGFTSVVGQYAYYMQANDPTFARSDLGQDMLTTVANGLNMAAEVIATPEPTRMCPWTGADPKVYVPYWREDGCDEYADLSSPYAIQSEAIQLPLGDARPASIGFTEDYEDYDWSFVGSYFDKNNVLWLLGLNRPTFLRYNFDIDRRTYDISLFRLFEPELRSFYDKIINLDGYFITVQTARDLGSYWCRDEGAPDIAYLGHFEPRRMIDPSATNPAVPGPSASCRNPALIYPELLRNMPFSAMLWAHALFSSDFDSELDMGKALKVYVVGADDDYPEWSSLPADQICSVVDSLTGLEYRAIHQPVGVPDLGCRLIQRTATVQTNWLGSNNDPYYKDAWRSWFERLEYARDLTRSFNR